MYITVLKRSPHFCTVTLLMCFHLLFYPFHPEMRLRELLGLSIHHFLTRTQPFKLRRRSTYWVRDFNKEAIANKYSTLWIQMKKLNQDKHFQQIPMGYLTSYVNNSFNKLAFYVLMLLNRPKIQSTNHWPPHYTEIEYKNMQLSTTW